MSRGTLVSVRIGHARDHVRPEWDHAAGRTWRSAYRKDEVAGPVRLTRLGLEGDEHLGSTHGGPHMAVLVYAAAHYPRWREERGLEGAGPGGFAENLTVDGLDESSVCVGDVYAVGDTLVEVAAPRRPCANIARIWDRPDLVQRVTETARTGWFLRVTREGALERGQVLERRARPHPEWTVERMFRVYAAASDAAELRAAAACVALPPEWRAKLVERAERAERAG